PGRGQGGREQGPPGRRQGPRLRRHRIPVEEDRARQLRAGDRRRSEDGRARGGEGEMKALVALCLASTTALAAPGAGQESGPGSFMTRGGKQAAAEPTAKAAEAPDDPIARYFAELAQMKLIDVESGNVDTLKRELAIGEELLRDGAYT